MTTTIPIEVPEIVPGAEESFHFDVNESMRLTRLFLHPRWACSVNVRLVLNRRFEMFSAPGWMYLSFTVDQSPEIWEWICGMIAKLSQVEHVELANLLRGVRVTSTGRLPGGSGVLLIPGVRPDVYVKNVGRETIPSGIIGAFFGDPLSAREAVQAIMDLPEMTARVLGIETSRWGQKP